MTISRLCPLPFIDVERCKNHVIKRRISQCMFHTLCLPLISTNHLYWQSLCVMKLGVNDNTIDSCPILRHVHFFEELWRKLESPSLRHGRSYSEEFAEPKKLMHLCATCIVCIKKRIANSRLCIAYASTVDFRYNYIRHWCATALTPNLPQTHKDLST